MTRTLVRSVTTSFLGVSAPVSTRSSVTVSVELVYRQLSETDRPDPTSTGIPDARPLVEGDIINLDVTLYHQGFHGDINATCSSPFSHLHLTRGT